jgi:AcrR family transcriptional regulator
MSRPPKITNDKILAVARQVFLEQGFGASTLAIAEKAGISEATIFKRFATKQALFMAAIGALETPKWVKQRQSRGPTQAIKAELIDICEQMLDFYQEVLPRVMLMMTQNNMPHPPSMPLPPPPVRDSLVLAKFLEQGISQGYLRAGDPQVMAHMLVGTIVNFVIVQNVAKNLPAPFPLPAPEPMSSPSMPPEPMSNTLFIHHLIESIWEGIRPQP